MFDTKKYFIYFFYILDDPSKPFKEEGDRIFFSYDDKISMSIEYYDPEAANAKATHPGIQKSLTNGKVNGSVDGNDSSGECEDKDLSKTNNNNNPNKRYLECPGSVKVQHLKKFITMKYELSEDFLVSKKYIAFYLLYKLKLMHLPLRNL